MVEWYSGEWCTMVAIGRGVEGFGGRKDCGGGIVVRGCTMVEIVSSVEGIGERKDSGVR